QRERGVAGRGFDVGLQRFAAHVYVTWSARHSCDDREGPGVLHFPERLDRLLRCFGIIRAAGEISQHGTDAVGMSAFSERLDRLPADVARRTRARDID